MAGDSERDELKKMVRIARVYLETVVWLGGWMVGRWMVGWVGRLVGWLGRWVVGWLGR